MTPLPQRLNPANHGLAAKIWECLRRNKDLIRVIDILNSHVGDGWDDAETAVGNHRFAAEVWLGMKSGDLKKDALSCWWKDMPREFCNTFEELAAARPGPKVVQAPPVDADSDLSSMSSQQAMRRWLMHNSGLWESSIVFAFPKRARDKEHLDTLLGEIRMKVKPTYKSTALEPQGYALGSPDQWEAYLLIAPETKKGRDDVLVRKEAAAMLYGPGKFKSFSSALTERVEAIEMFIKSVYPDDPLL